MASGTKSNSPSASASASVSPCDLDSDGADISMGSGGLQSQLELLKHDEHSIYHGDKIFKRGKARPAKRRDRSPNTWYWQYGEEIYEDNQRRWMCEPCWEDKKFTHYTQNSNRSIIKHLEETHEISEDDCASGIRLKITPPDNTSASTSITRHTPSFFDWEILKLQLIEWIVVMHIAFSQVQNDWFRRFLAALSPKLEKWIPKAGNTIRDWILAEFEQQQKEVKKQLHTSKSRIHLSFDLWTSPNHLSFVRVVTHYISPKYNVETVLLRLCCLQGPHSGKNIAKAILKIIDKYDLTISQIR